jgi:hypothetical protein
MARFSRLAGGGVLTRPQAFFLLFEERVCTSFLRSYLLPLSPRDLDQKERQATVLQNVHAYLHS